MRYLLVGIAARLGWTPPRPCPCFDTVNESAKAHAETYRELAEARAQITDLQEENDQLRELLAKARRVPAPRQEATT